MTDSKFYSNSYGNVFGTMVPTPIGRANFVHLAQPNAKYGQPKYGLHILFPKNDEKTKAGLNALISACMEVAKQKFGDKAPAFTYPPLRDGDELTYQGFQGCYYLKASAKRQPEIVDTTRKGLDVNLIVPGVLVRAVVTPILFDSGFSWQLSTVQFVKDDGVRYYGGPDPKSLLSALDEEPSPSASQAADEVLGTGKKEEKPAKTGKASALELL